MIRLQILALVGAHACALTYVFGALAAVPCLSGMLLCSALCVLAGLQPNRKANNDR